MNAPKGITQHLLVVNLLLSVLSFINLLAAWFTNNRRHLRTKHLTAK